MSALAERSEWRGEDVSAGEVAERLMALNREHARHEHGHAATRTLNLLVAPGDDVAPDALATQLGGLADRHPSRTIMLREHAAPRIDAHVAIDCTIGSGAGCAGHCHDMALLAADAERLAHADSLVRPLRVAGLPTVLWLPGTRASHAQDPLATLADAIVLDSGSASGPGLRAAFHRVAALDGARVRDVAWLRLRRWRRHVAARFDDPEARSLLRRVERVELRSCAPQQASALLLAADRRARRLGDRAPRAGGRRLERRRSACGRRRRRDRARPAGDAGPHRHPRARAARRRRDDRAAGARRSAQSGARVRRRIGDVRHGDAGLRAGARGTARRNGGAMIELTVTEDAEAAAQTCAERVATTIEQARAERGAAHVALAGGTTPARTYELLPRLVEDWRDVHLWLGDERCVALDDPDSNAVLVRDTLFGALAADGPGPVFHRVERAGDGDPPAAAAAYERELRAAIPGDPLPQLDLALLGLGEDGHTASLFPDDPVLEERERLVVAVRGRKPPPDRVTLTLPVLRAARAIVVLTAGAGKAEAVAAVLAGPSPHVPASLLGEGGAVELIADRAAAR